jgi:hypothetical protein
MNTVRWYSSDDLFRTLHTPWPYIVHFAEEEQLTMPGLNDKVKADLGRMQKLSAAFTAGQKQVESLGFSIDSLFISNLLALERRFGDFRECEPEAHDAVVSYIHQLRSDSEGECDIFIRIAFLNSSVQFQMGRTCSQEAYERARDALTDLVQMEIDLDIDLNNICTVPEEPASGDFHILIPSTCARPFGADEQVSFYARVRASAFHPLNYWQPTPAELKH